MPPLVPCLRREVKAWRDRGYEGAADTSKGLLRWWFIQEHLLPKGDGRLHEFRYYFAQREALETIVYLYDVVGVKDKYDLMRFDQLRRGFREHVRRDLAALCGQNGHRRGQDQSAEPGARLVLLPQALRTRFAVGPQFSGHCAEHHRAGQDLQGFSGAGHLLQGPGAARRRVRRPQLARRFPAYAAPAGRRAGGAKDGQHLPDEHPPRVCGQRIAPFSRRREHDGLFPRPAAGRRRRPKARWTWE